MKITKILLTLLLVGAVFLSVPVPQARALERPEISAQSAILVEKETGTVLFEQNADARRDQASLTKLTTVLLAVEYYEQGKIALEEKVMATADAMFDITEDSSTAEIQPGEELTYEELLYRALVASANEACNILGITVAGSVGAFVDQMNSRVAELGCLDTHYMNPHGLTAENHYTTARDEYLILNEALKHPLMCQIMQTATYYVQPTNMSDRRTLRNTNRLIDGSSAYYYSPCLGGKTGSTSAAGYCLASYAADKDENDNPITLLCVVLGAEEVEDGYGGYDIESFTESRELFRWGFLNFSFRQIVRKGELVTKAPVSMGDGTDAVNLVPEKAVEALVANDVEDERFQREITVYCIENEQELVAPVNAGEELGRMVVRYGGEVYADVKLVANTDVALLKSEYFKQEVRQTLNKPIVKTVIIGLIVVFLIYLALMIRYNIIKAKQRKAKREKMRQMRRQRRELEKEQEREGVRVPSKNETDRVRQEAARSTDKKKEDPITFEDFYNRTK